MNPSRITLNDRCRLGVSLAVVAFFLGATTAQAQPRIVEFQVASDKLTSLLWDRLLNQEICELSFFPFPPPSGPTGVLDRVEFPTQPQVMRTNAGAQIIAAVDVYAKAVNCLTDPLCGRND